MSLSASSRKTRVRRWVREPVGAGSSRRLPWLGEIPGIGGLFSHQQVRREDKLLLSATVRIAVLTVSDTRDEESDTSGHLLAERVKGAGHELAEKRLVPDDVDAIRTQINAWVASGSVDAIVTTGGTGLTGRDVTPEAFRTVYDKEIEGFGELFRWISFAEIGTSTIQSRAEAALCDTTYVFLLPGSTGAVKTAMEKILLSQLDHRHRPCNFVELLPRIHGEREDG